MPVPFTDVVVKPDLVLPFRFGSLRPLAINDVHSGYVDGLNNPEVNSYLEIRHEHQTQASVEEFVNINNLSTDSLLLGIYLHEYPRHIGTIRLHTINQSLGHAHIGICIFDRLFWGKGIGSTAIKAVTSWAYSHLSITCIEAHAFLDNCASIRLFEKAGFRRIDDGFKSLPAEVHPVQHAVLVYERA